MKRLMWFALIVLCVAQVGVIGYQIYSYESILSQGELYTFRVRPLDPYDAFRGRYVTLRYEGMDKVKFLDKSLPTEPKELYGLLKHTPKGDIVESMTFQKPSGVAYVRVESFLTPNVNGGKEYRVSLPYNRFYMKEDLAPLAEEMLRTNEKEVYAKLRVLNGKAVIEALEINGKPINEVLQQEVDAAAAAPAIKP